MNSFGNKPLVVLDWSLKSRKRFHRCLSNCDQGKIIREIYSFIKEYYHKNCTHNLLILIKYFVSHIFPIVLLTLQDFHEICAYKFLARLLGPLCLSSLFPKRWSLPRQWHLKRLKLHMLTRVMPRLSLPNQHIATLSTLSHVAKQNWLLHH